MNYDEEISPKEEDRIFHLGFDAYHADVDREDGNPYQPDSEEFDVWKHGWDSAFECEVLEENEE